MKGQRRSHRKRQGGAQRVPRGGRHTFQEILVSDGLNKALQMHNSAAIVDHFPRRMEKVSDIIPTSTAFQIQSSLFLNPGNSVLFPIFSQIAAVYEQYRCRFLRFHYVTEAYTASGTNVSAGKVIMATNFDPNDSAFANATQMENYAGADRGAPFSNFTHDVMRSMASNKAMPLKEYYVNPGANTANPSNDTTEKFFDMGLFQFATAGLPSASSVEYGELYVEYEFDLIRPKQQTPLGQSLLATHIVEGAAGTAAAAASKFLGTTGGLLRAGSNIPCVATASTFTLPVAGRFSVACAFAGSVTVVPTLSVGSNITAVSLLNDSSIASLSAVAASTAVLLTTFDVATAGTGAANTVTISGLTNLASGTADIFISQVPTSLTENLEEKEIQVLQSQVEKLERVMRHLLVRVPDCQDDDYIAFMRCDERKEAATLIQSDDAMNSIVSRETDRSSVSRNNTPLSEKGVPTKSSYFSLGRGS